MTETGGPDRDPSTSPMSPTRSTLIELPLRLELPKSTITDEQLMLQAKTSEEIRMASEKFVWIRFMQGLAAKLGDHPIRNLALATLAAFSPEIVDLANQASGHINELSGLHDSPLISSIHDTARFVAAEAVPTIVGAYLGKAASIFRRSDARVQRDQVATIIKTKNGYITPEELAPLFLHGKIVLNEELQVWINDGFMRNNRRDPRAKVVSDLFKARKTRIKNRTNSDTMNSAKRETLNLLLEAQMLGLELRSLAPQLSKDELSARKDVLTGSFIALAIATGISAISNPETAGILGYGDEAIVYGAIFAETINERLHRGSVQRDVISNKERPGVSSNGNKTSKILRALHLK